MSEANWLHELVSLRFPMNNEPHPLVGKIVRTRHALWAGGKELCPADTRMRITPKRGNATYPLTAQKVDDENWQIAVRPFDVIAEGDLANVDVSREA